ncbi:MAG: tetratricopeptide repeat protein [Microcoleus sp. PH2017_40_RAT_O_B]|uniref:CHAT domain-containing protein n=1 Tax=unclassified Microcoleus TaxID=2642155 RepID=UPI001DBC5A83|nr:MULTISPECIES: CHAT domain-containing protein [unclassified Microcoleus]MCC3574216.1 tetratricopeptide repeat protein [Microcoleus sp. PH2017_34_RAT_O_A]MCC3611666.1 tetratricopeptide repeat protein [Microcoleus sp. PH2017_40_RAT_O_B]
MKSKKQTYFDLIESLLNSPNQEAQIGILKAKKKLIDDDFADFLRKWATKILAENNFRHARDIIINILNFSNLIQDFPLGSTSSNMEIAIAGYEVGLNFFNRYDDPEKWGVLQNSLGTAYTGRIKGERQDNLEKAIAFYQAASQVHIRSAFPEQWAMIQNNFGEAYRNRIKGERGENIEKAIAFYQAASEVYARPAFPQNWALTQNNLAAAYLVRIKGERGENIEKAIALSEAASEIYTRPAFPQQWAMTQNNLAIAYKDRIKGERQDNLEKAIAFYQAALQVYTRPTFPQNWAMTQNNLANVYKDRIKGERGENIEKAIALSEAASEVLTRPVFPEQWAMTQNNLAAAYSDRIKGERGENIERAIAFYQAASEVYTRHAFPEQWAGTQHNLANAYYRRIKGERGENIERAIAFSEAALQVRTRDAFPQDWAQTQNNLATAYSDRIKGERGENIEKAIALYQAASEVYTRHAFPEQWAMTQHNLAIAYYRRINGEEGENIEKAIVFFQAASEVYTRPAFPELWAGTQHNLANAYSDRIKGDRAENIEKAIALYEAALQVCTPTALPIDCLQTAGNLGNLGFTESLWETAIFGYEKAIEAVEQSREWIPSENRKREIIAENLNVYEKMIQSCINHQQYHKAIQTIERSKSRYLVELFTNSEIYPKTATQTEKQQLQNLRRQIASLQQSPQQQQDNLATALQQLEQYLEIFKQREPEFKLTQKIQPIDIPEFQKTLDTETAIVEWYIGNSNSDNSWGGVAFIITHNNIELITYTTTELAELETWKNDYLNEYRDKAKQKIWQQTLSAKLYKLSEILRVNEIVATIPNHCRQLILIPHRYLHLFPLHALPFTLEGGHGGTAPTKYLLDCFPDGVKYAPSLQLLELVQNRIKTRTSPAPELQPLFAIQNPTEDLSNADMEVQIIKQRFDTHDILIKQQATKIAFNENLKNLSNASYIHFSCHGVFNFDYPLLSLLALADSIEENNETDAESRYVTMRSGRKAIPEKCLTLREIFADLELSKCNLVTLSACETGLTSSTEMTDEYIGLPSGFLYAGSMNVVSTLWSVDDFATAILMIKFYQELLPKVSVAVALNAAQNWMRAVTKEDFGVWVKSLNLDKKSGQSVELWLVSSLEERPFSHPKYWAAFCATGY